MDISGLKKIVSDGKNKLKAYDEADRALDALDSLDQWKKDLTRENEDLGVRNERLKSDKAKYEQETLAAFEKSKEEKSKAENRANTILSDAQNKANDIERIARESLEKTQALHFSKKEEISSLDKAIAKRQADLDAINLAIEGMKEKAQKLFGE